MYFNLTWITADPVYQFTFSPIKKFYPLYNNEKYFLTIMFAKLSYFCFHFMKTEWIVLIWHIMWPTKYSFYHFNLLFEN